VEVQGTIARHFLVPGLPAFFAQYPEIELSMSESDRWVDLVQEGVDCALRYGKLRDSELVARPVAMLDIVTCATPQYLERFGVPDSLQALAGHRAVGMRGLSTGSLVPLEFTVGAETERITLPCVFSVTGPETYLAGIRLGLGLAQVPRFHIEQDLRDGTLVPFLTETPPPSVPVSLLYPRNRQLSPRVRVFLDWAAREFATRSTTAKGVDPD
jgi:DNA-binding transcriptional LysR family regulator